VARELVVVDDELPQLRPAALTAKAARLLLKILRAAERTQSRGAAA